jgi:hypothetical protein
LSIFWWLTAIFVGGFGVGIIGVVLTPLSDKHPARNRAHSVFSYILLFTPLAFCLAFMLHENKLLDATAPLWLAASWLYLLIASTIIFIAVCFRKKIFKPHIAIFQIIFSNATLLYFVLIIVKLCGLIR